jgi:hypothetical protein
MKLAWVEDRQVARVPSESISTTRIQINRLGQVVDERGGITISPFYAAVGTAATVAGAYHGYKRNNSVGWAIVWGLLSGPFWPIAVPVMLAEGFGKRK